MKLIGLGEVLNQGISILLSRAAAVLSIRLAAVLAGMGVSVFGMRDFMLRVQQSARESKLEAESLGELLRQLPPEQLMQALSSPLLWAAVAANILTILWAQGAVYLALYPNLKTEPPAEARGVFGAILGGLKLLFPLLLVNIIFGVLVTAGFIPLIGVSAWLYSRTGGPSAAMLLALPLVAPGLWLAVKFLLAPLVVAVENRSAFSSLGRSSELAKGFWWPLFWRLALPLVLAIAGYWLLGRVPFVGGLLAAVVFPPFVNACQLAILEDLRKIKHDTEPSGPAEEPA